MKRSTDRRWSPAENMKRKPYQNVDVLKYLQGKYKIGGDAGGAETGRKQCEK